MDYVRVMPGYFETMGIEVLDGRGIDDRDQPGGQWVAVIDESLARFWPDGNAVGNLVNMSGVDWRVVGIARHARIYNVYEDARPQVYVPYTQYPAATVAVAARSALDPASLVPGIRQAFAKLDPSLPLFNVRTMEDVVRQSTSDRRFATSFVIWFSLVGLLLAAMGVYGILAFTVANRRREIGIRMALGAQDKTLSGWILRQGLALAGVGVLIGALGALLVARLISGWVFEIRPWDPLTFGLVFLLVLLSAVAACYLPAKRACRTNLLEVIKSE